MEGMRLAMSCLTSVTRRVYMLCPKPFVIRDQFIVRTAARKSVYGVYFQPSETVSHVLVRHRCV